MAQWQNFLIFFLLPVFIFGQSSIGGTVSDRHNNPIFFATIALHEAGDSSFVKAVSSSQDGGFKFMDIEKGQYYLTVSMLSYEDFQSESIVVPLSQEESIEITLDEDATLLNTVEIKDRLPLMEQKADKLIVNIENNMSNTSGSLLDVMKRVPGMLVVNDRLTMPGTGSPTILINGKTTQYMDVQSLLRDMPGDNIKKVEIIHQPGAEYEAAGSGPIINIILKKNSLFGTNGSVTFGVGKGDLWDYTSGLNLSHYAGRLNIAGSIGYSKNAWVESISLERRLSGISESIDGEYIQTNYDAATPETYRGEVRLDWDLTDKHRLGLQSRIYDNTNIRTATNETNVFLYSSTAQDYRLDTENAFDRGWSYFSVNPYYEYSIDTLGQKLELDFNMGRYQVEGQNVLTTVRNTTGAVQQQRYIQPGDTRIYATTMDYTRPLNASWELKTGVKYSFADLDNDLQSEFFADGMWQNNPFQSNHYLFDEKIYAGYGKVQFSEGPWTATAGLRYEHSNSVGNSLTLDSTLTRTISKLFPSFSLSRKIAGPLGAGISYSYRIDRPRYSTLNPFVYYLDPFTFETGNPNIRPELTHSGQFTLTMEGQPFFKIEYKRSNNAIVEVTQQEPDSEEASKTDINFDKATNFSTSLFFPLNFIPGIGGGYGGVIVARNAYNSLYNDGLFERSRWSITSFIQAEFTLPGDINGEAGGWYVSGMQEGIFNSEHLFGTRFGLSKKFLDNKLKVSVGVEDFVNRFWHANVDYQQDMDLMVQWQAPVVNMRLSYKFGNQHLKGKKSHTGSAAEELRRASQEK